MRKTGHETESQSPSRKIEGDTDNATLKSPWELSEGYLGKEVTGKRAWTTASLERREEEGLSHKAGQWAGSKRAASPSRAVRAPRTFCRELVESEPGPSHHPWPVH